MRSNWQSFQENGKVLIEPHLMTSIEIDELIDRVIADAETFRRLAKYELDSLKLARTGCEA